MIYTVLEGGADAVLDYLPRRLRDNIGTKHLTGSAENGRWILNEIYGNSYQLVIDRS